MVEYITDIVAIIGVCVLLPVLVVFLVIRRKMAAEHMRKEIILAALEKDTNLDIQGLVREMNSTQKMIKERLLNKLQWGVLCSVLALGILLYVLFLLWSKGGCVSDEIKRLILWGCTLLAVGLSMLCVYWYGKKMLAKEMEMELRALESLSDK